MTDQMMSCPGCHERILASSSKCMFCGAAFGGAGSARVAGDYAGFWVRFVAAFVDGLVILALGAVGVFLARFNGGRLLGIIGGWLYAALLESSSAQATLGKQLLGLRVTDLDGNRIGFGRATGRHFAKILSAIPLFIGYLMVAFTERKQGLHDLLAGTLVVRG